MEECDPHITLICGYCGAEITTVYGIPDKNSLNSLLPETCPYCGRRFNKVIDWFNVKVEFDLARAKECEKKKNKKE